MNKLQTPEADFYEILQVRINEIKATPFDNSDIVIDELEYLQGQFSSYLYKIRNKKQCD